MSCNWPIQKLGDLCKEITVGYVGSMTKEYVDDGVPFFRSKNISEYQINWDDIKYVSPEFHQKLKKSSLSSGDVAIVRTGKPGTCCVIPEDVTEANCSDIVIARVDESKLCAHYLSFFMNSIANHQVSSRLVGAVQQHFNVSAAKQIEIPLPSRSEQTKIVHVLKTISDKISLNIRTNHTLEEMAQTIFKSWFVDFDPVKAKMNGEQPEGMDAATASLFPEKLVSDTGLPEGWKLSEIGDEVSVVGGGTPSKKNDDFWVDGHIHWTSPKDLSGVQDKVLLETASKLTEAGLKKVSSGLLPVDTVLLSSRAPVGYLALAKVPLAVNQGYIAMRCEKVLPPEFVLQWCVHRMDEIKQRASGSTFAEISKKNFKPISVVVPSKDVLNAYQKLVKPLYDAITSNVRQSEQLSNLRDTLLPKLLSGELTLTDPVEVTNV